MRAWQRKHSLFHPATAKNENNNGISGRRFSLSHAGLKAIEIKGTSCISSYPRRTIQHRSSRSLFHHFETNAADSILDSTMNLQQSPSAPNGPQSPAMSSPSDGVSQQAPGGLLTRLFRRLPCCGTDPSNPCRYVLSRGLYFFTSMLVCDNLTSKSLFFSITIPNTDHKDPINRDIGSSFPLCSWQLSWYFHS